jgi:ribonuclease E
VREPAPVFGTDASAAVSMPALHPASPAPPPEPAVTGATADDEASKPRRTGWWAKRFLGGDKG